MLPKMWAFMPICLLCSLVLKLTMVGESDCDGVDGVMPSIKRESHASALCLWTSCAESTAGWIGQPVVDGESATLEWDGSVTALCSRATCAEAFAEWSGVLDVLSRGSELFSWWSVWSQDSPQRRNKMFCITSWWYGDNA